MQSRSSATVLAVSCLAFSSIGLAQSSERINPMIALHERGLPVFGVAHPAIVAGRGPGNTTGTTVPASPPSLTEAAQATVAYRFSDFAYNNYSTENAARFHGYMSAILAAGGSAREHAFICLDAGSLVTDRRPGAQESVLRPDPSAATPADRSPCNGRSDGG